MWKPCVRRHFLAICSSGCTAAQRRNPHFTRSLHSHGTDSQAQEGPLLTQSRPILCHIPASRQIDRASKLAFRSLHYGLPRARWLPKIGSEPGIDPGTNEDRHDLHKSQPDVDSEIKIIDFSNKRMEEHYVSTGMLETFLEQPKPEWAAVRWIYVNGLNLNVVKCLGNSKGLHPLAVEDVMDTQTPTKVDWYDNHCFLEMNLVKLVHDNLPPSGKASAEIESTDQLKERGKWRMLVPGKFSMSVEQVSAFLTSDNTVITIFDRSGSDILSPIMTRLQSPQTVVRSSNDASMLLQAVIDAIVDTSLPIGKAVGEAFDELEQAVLAKPTIGQSKQLHVLRSGLTLLMENANAIGILVRTLSDHGAVPGSGRSDSPPAAAGDALRSEHVNKTSIEISPTTQIYLRDVQDHVTALANYTHMSIRSAETLSSLIFNTIAASQNESVRQLTLISSFFLPLTFLTGYFGMNFDPMPIVNEHSDAYFWLIAGPVMVTTLGLLLRARVRANRSETWMKQARPIQPRSRLPKR